MSGPLSNGSFVLSWRGVESGERDDEYLRLESFSKQLGGFAIEIYLVCILCPFRRRQNQYKVLLNDHLYPAVKYFYPDMRGLFHSRPHSQGTERINEEEALYPG